MTGLIPARAGNTFRGWLMPSVSRAHPRSRGEHSGRIGESFRPLGSSPLARGTLREDLGCVGVYGLIPARAGNTSVPPCARPPNRAHPRSRGEHIPASRLASSRAGSSPLARGTRLASWWVQGVGGLIPARAGNTRALSDRCRGRRAHPRSRGEHMKTVTQGILLSGSSPLARGTLTATCEGCQVAGLIPARAGNTPGTLRGHHQTRAHPRSRGEHQPLLDSFRWWRGSSPLARGTRRAHVLAHCRVGLIPARAGNTEQIHQMLPPDGAHPRSRGEHRSMMMRTLVGLGSSPLARGTQLHAGHGSLAQGLIPARAGNTCEPFREGLWSWAHPRSRGEHVLILYLYILEQGSSPLARGTRF